MPYTVRYAALDNIAEAADLDFETDDCDDYGNESEGLESSSNIDPLPFLEEEEDHSLVLDLLGLSGLSLKHEAQSYSISKFSLPSFTSGSLLLLSGNDILTDEDRDNIRAFRLWVKSNMARESFNMIRAAFSHKMQIGTQWRIAQRVGVLTGITPDFYDCCINSCVAYLGAYEHDSHCKFCRERRFKGKGANKTARRKFCYFPIIPQLQGFFQSPEMIELMSYRQHYVSSSEMIRDVFDAKHYKKLCKKHVSIDGVGQPHKYFSHDEDIALGLCVDSYLLFNRRRSGPCGTPIILQNYNVPPDIRTHLNMLICAGMIPGPKQPKDIASFLLPLEDELAILAATEGVETYHATKDVIFPLHAYNIFNMGDIVAIEKLIGLKGHNSFSPCRSCKLKGVRNMEGSAKIYYLPLSLPKGTEYAPFMRARDAWSLPMRRHSDWETVMADIDSAESKKQKEEISKEHGIKRHAALQRVPSVNLSVSVPWDWMHLFLENVIPNLVKLWTGSFKNLDAGSEQYELASAVWAEIGKVTKEATKTIPSCFVRSLGNIAEEQSNFVAESWCFWFIYLMPILLKGRFMQEKYYKHACDLVEIMKMTLHYNITQNEIDGLEDGIVQWVKTYERYRAEKITQTLMIDMYQQQILPPIPRRVIINLHIDYPWIASCCR